MKNKLCYNILNYDDNYDLDVEYDGTIESQRYYCSTADLLDNSHFIRFGSIGDGSCLLHAIFTNNEFYYNLSYDGKIEFVNQVRKKLAGKVRALTPDKLFKYFSHVELYLLIDSTVLPKLANNYNYNRYELETLWQQAIVRIDKKPNITFTDMKKIILETLKVKKNREFSIDFLKNLDQAFVEIRENYANLMENTGNWLGAPEYLFLSDQLDANFYILRFEQYGIVLGQEAAQGGQKHSAFINPKRKHNYIIAWDEAHYELVGIKDSKDKITTNFSFKSPIVNTLVYLASTRPREICQKYPLLSLFYNCEENTPCQFLYPPKLLPKNESPQEGAITFTKNIVEKLKHSGEDNVTKFLHALLKKYDKITTSSFKISSTSDAWKRTTIKNISECFSISKDFVLLGEYAIQVDHNGKQLAVAMVDIARPSKLEKKYDIPISTGKNNCAFIHSLCVPLINRRKGYCKLLMKEIYNLFKKNKQTQRRKSPRRSSPRRSISPRRNISPRRTSNRKRRRLRRSRRFQKKKIRRTKFNNNLHITKKVSCFYLEVYADNIGAIKCYAKFKKINTSIKNGKKIFLLELK